MDVLHKQTGDLDAMVLCWLAKGIRTDHQRFIPGLVSRGADAVEWRFGVGHLCPSALSGRCPDDETFLASFPPDRRIGESWKLIVAV
jgi:hypothetical protein